MTIEKLSVGSVWTHQNGHRYEIIGLAREQDLCVFFVVHKGLHDGRLWVRSLANFLDFKNGKPRFVKEE